MLKVNNVFERGGIPSLALLAAGFTALASLVGFLLAPALTGETAEMRIEPKSVTIVAGETVTIDVVVHASVPVNVFAGQLQFDPSILRVESIDYNTSIADLWTELPWYENGDGTLTFAGGTTKSGGFFGTGSLVTVHFTALQEGDGDLVVRDARVLRHDGLGTDIPQDQPIDALITVEENTEGNVLRDDTIQSKVAIVKEPPDTDLSGDGRTSIADISIFMVHLASKNTRSDFNGDGKVNTRDFSILMDMI